MSKEQQLINLTKHESTVDQQCIDFTGESLKLLRRLLTFDDMPNAATIRERASLLADMALNACHMNDCSKAMIGGAPFLMPDLKVALRKRGIRPYYALLKREVIETDRDGEKVKTATFKHIGFIEAN